MTICTSLNEFLPHDWLIFCPNEQLSLKKWLIIVYLTFALYNTN